MYITYRVAMPNINLNLDAKFLAQYVCAGKKICICLQDNQPHISYNSIIICLLEFLNVNSIADVIKLA